MGRRLRRRQDDHRAAGPAHAPLPHRGDWQRELPRHPGHSGHAQTHQGQGQERRNKGERGGLNKRRATVVHSRHQPMPAPSPGSRALIAAWNWASVARFLHGEHPYKLHTRFVEQRRCQPPTIMQKFAFDSPPASNVLAAKMGANSFLAFNLAASATHEQRHQRADRCGSRPLAGSTSN